MHRVVRGTEDHLGVLFGFAEEMILRVAFDWAVSGVAVSMRA